jgi:hypothetical protein
MTLSFDELLKGKWPSSDLLFSTCRKLDLVQRRNSQKFYNWNREQCSTKLGTLRKTLKIGVVRSYLLLGKKKKNSDINPK